MAKGLSARWNFVADADGAKADWAKNLPATLEAMKLDFWGFSLFFGAIQSCISFKKVLGRKWVLFCFCGFLRGSDSSMIFIYIYIIHQHIPNFQLSPASSESQPS